MVVIALVVLSASGFDGPLSTPSAALASESTDCFRADGVEEAVGANMSWSKVCMQELRLKHTYR